MSIFQFLRIFIARWLIIVVAMFSAAVGAFVVSMLVQPRYQATARVKVDIANRPDPISGESLRGRAAFQAYADAQRQLILDYQVTGRVVDAFGWATDPGLIRAYQGRPKTDTREFRRWLAQRVADSTQVGFNGLILEITYSSNSPETSKLAAETLRDAYLEESVNDRRSYAQRYATWFSAQTDAARRQAEEAELAKAAYERESGIILQNNSDLDSQRLMALAGQSSLGTVAAAASPNSSTSALQLAQLDATIAEQEQRLGPNHPRMIELRKQREQVSKVAAQEQAAAKAAVSGATGAEVIRRALEEQKSKVIGQRDKVERLRQLQAEVELKRGEYERMSAKASDLALQAENAVSNATPLGPVVPPRKPVFPNKSLMVGGATGLGLGLGLALALLLELLNRRVRGVEDLDFNADIPCLGVLEEPGARTRMAVRRLVYRIIPRRVGAAV